MTTVPIEICLQGFNRAFGFQCIGLHEVEKGQEQAGGFSCSGDIPLEQVAREGPSWVEYVHGQVGAF